ncbi:hypothetical protein L484_001282 [Morus notabilis]|uniref:Uncharacterized protein n=1 Tax=Morus notabilis TaxID=981085 RepID=W9RIE9_9ROSA|nr:hypothetical protein L484_001282 [Morus notabilis]
MAVEDVQLLRISPSDSNGSSIPTPTPRKEQQAAGVRILLQIMMLVLSFILSHVLRRHKFYYLPEAIASLLIAVSAGLNAKKIGAIFRQKTGREVRDPHHGAEIRAIVLDWTIFFSSQISSSDLISFFQFSLS